VTIRDPRKKKHDKAEAEIGRRIPGGAHLPFGQSVQSLLAPGLILFAGHGWQLVAFGRSE
jgi:hypothetical protein